MRTVTSTPSTYLVFRRATWHGKWSFSNRWVVHDEIHVCCSSRRKSLFSTVIKMALHGGEPEHQIMRNIHSAYTLSDIYMVPFPTADVHLLSHMDRRRKESNWQPCDYWMACSTC